MQPSSKLAGFLDAVDLLAEEHGLTLADVKLAAFALLGACDGCERRKAGSHVGDSTGAWDALNNREHWAMYMAAYTVGFIEGDNQERSENQNAH